MINPNKAALCGVLFSIAKNKGIHAPQAKTSRLYLGKVRVSSIPLNAANRGNLISLSVRYFKKSGLQY